MEKDNKYYDLIKNLIKTHRKYNNSYEPIIDDLIDDVYKHAKAVIGSVRNEEVISSYLQKLISVSIITVPKRMNFHNEISHRIISPAPMPAAPVQQVVTPVQEIETPAPEIVTPAPEININENVALEASAPDTPKANVEFVDRMINSINEDSFNEPEALAQEDTTADGLQEQIDELEADLSDEDTDDELIIHEEATETSNIIEPAEPDNDYVLDADNEEDKNISGEQVIETDLLSSDMGEDDDISLTENFEETEDNNSFSLEEESAEEENDITKANDEIILDETPEETENLPELDISEEENDIAEDDDEVILDETPDETEDLQELNISEEENNITEDDDETVLDELQEATEAFELASETTDDITDLTEDDSFNQADEAPLPQPEYELPETTEDITELAEDINADTDLSLLEETESLEAIEGNDDLLSLDTAETFEELPAQNNLEVIDDIGLAENTDESEIISPDAQDELTSFEADLIEPESDFDDLSELGTDTTTEEDEEELDHEYEDNKFDSDTYETEDFSFTKTSTEEKIFKPVDYSLFNFAQKEENTETPDVQDIENKLNELNAHKPDLNIAKVFDLKYKQNLSVAKIAEELNTDIQTVISALDEIVELI